MQARALKTILTYIFMQNSIANLPKYSHISTYYVRYLNHDLACLTHSQVSTVSNLIYIKFETFFSFPFMKMRIECVQKMPTRPKIFSYF